MPTRFQACCLEPGCTVRTAERGGYCNAHRANNSRTAARREYDHERKKDSVWQLYGPAWVTFKNALRANGNVICQRLVDGSRCRRATEIFHHIFSPRTRPDLMYTPRFVVGVCRQHHPPTEGEPVENLPRLAELYV